MRYLTAVERQNACTPARPDFMLHKYNMLPGRAQIGIQWVALTSRMGMIPIRFVDGALGRWRSCHSEDRAARWLERREMGIRQARRTGDATLDTQ
jgi:hypothetical protein